MTKIFLLCCVVVGMACSTNPHNRVDMIDDEMHTSGGTLIQLMDVPITSDINRDNISWTACWETYDGEMSECRSGFFALAGYPVIGVPPNFVGKITVQIEVGKRGRR